MTKAQRKIRDKCQQAKAYIDADSDYKIPPTPRGRMGIRNNRSVMESECVA